LKLAGAVHWFQPVPVHQEVRGGATHTRRRRCDRDRRSWRPRRPPAAPLRRRWSRRECEVLLMTGAARADRGAGTREVILDTAERLFVEHGTGVVSNRQISEAAGQGNNTAVGYHFGTRADLVRAI